MSTLLKPGGRMSKMHGERARKSERMKGIQEKDAPAVLRCYNAIGHETGRRRTVTGCETVSSGCLELGRRIPAVVSGRARRVG